MPLLAIGMLPVNIKQGAYKMQFAKEIFNRKAFQWDRYNPADAKYTSMMLELADIKENSRIIDLGCGTGELVSQLLSYDPSCILGVDFAENMIKVAKNKVSDKRAQFIVGDIYDMDLSQKFDYCFLYNSYPHFADKVKLFGIINSLLVSHGKVIIAHNSGKTEDSGFYPPPLPAQGIINLIKNNYRLEVIIDNNKFFMVCAHYLKI